MVLLIQKVIEKEEKGGTVWRVGQHANTWWCPAYTRRMPPPLAVQWRYNTAGRPVQCMHVLMKTWHDGVD
jgi:hypothetical protein